MDPEMFTRAEAIASGLTDDELGKMRASGVLVAIRPGFYVPGTLYDAAHPSERHLILARSFALHCADDEVLSHVSAALAWGFGVWNIPLNRVHMSHGKDFASKRRPLRILHGTPLSADERVRVNGLAVTSAARTVVDVARSWGFEQAVCVGDSALHLGHTTPGLLGAALASAHHRTGVAQARRAVEFISGRSESVGESRSRVLIETLGLPTPLLNQWVHDSNGLFVGRVDFLFPLLHVIGEFDGEKKYKSPKTLLDEKYREDRLRDLGWTVVRWGWRDLDDPRRFGERLAQAFARGARMAKPDGSFGDDRLGT